MFRNRSIPSQTARRVCDEPIAVTCEKGCRTNCFASGPSLLFLGFRARSRRLSPGFSRSRQSHLALGVLVTAASRSWHMLLLRSVRALESGIRTKLHLSSVGERAVLVQVLFCLSLLSLLRPTRVQNSVPGQVLCTCAFLQSHIVT